MTEKQKSSGGIGFFVALLVVIPTATWVGMLIPQMVVDLAAGAHRYLGDLGLTASAGNPPASVAARSGPDRIEATINAPWAAPSPQRNEKHTPTSADLRGNHNPPSGGELVARSTAQGDLPLQWAGRLIQQATSAAGENLRGSSQAVLPATHRAEESGRGFPSATPASFTEVGAGHFAPGQGQIETGTNLRHQPGRPDAVSLVGWDPDLSRPEGSDLPSAARHEQSPRPTGNPNGRWGQPARDVQSVSSTLETTSVASPITNPASSAETQRAPAFFSPADGRVHELELRLRQLGATAYTLEQDTATGLYYFAAEVPPPRSQGENTVFEAAAPNPYQAIETVVSKIEAARGSRSTP